MHQPAEQDNSIFGYGPMSNFYLMELIAHLLKNLIFQVDLVDLANQILAMFVYCSKICFLFNLNSVVREAPSPVVRV